MCQDFTSARLFSKTEEGTLIHVVKSSDSVLCSESETIILLATTKGKDSSNKYIRIAVVHGCYYILVALLKF